MKLYEQNIWKELKENAREINVENKSVEKMPWGRIVEEMFQRLNRKTM